MSERETWARLKEKRAGTPERRAGYERARRAFELGEKVRMLREQRRLTQAELANRLDTTVAVIERLELGGAEPSFDTLERICAALDADLVVDLRPHL